jgi:hypothetical protein
MTIDLDLFIECSINGQLSEDQKQTLLLFLRGHDGDEKNITLYTHTQGWKTAVFLRVQRIFRSSLTDFSSQ